MPRDKAPVRRRLQQAALELFSAQGFEQTTSAEIAQRAGVTERTFFRHFADKREILFDGQTEFLAKLTEAASSAPPSCGPVQALFRAFVAVEPQLEANRAFSAPRARLIAEVPALQERALAKHAALNSTLTEALKARGVEPRLAALAAQTAVAAFGQAFEAWLAEPTRPPHSHLLEAFHDLNRLWSATDPTA